MRILRTIKCLRAAWQISASFSTHRARLAFPREFVCVTAPYRTASSGNGELFPTRRPRPMASLRPHWPSSTRSVRFGVHSWMEWRSSWCPKKWQRIQVDWWKFSKNTKSSGSCSCRHCSGHCCYICLFRRQHVPKSCCTIWRFGSVLASLCHFNFQKSSSITSRRERTCCATSMVQPRWLYWC